MIGFPAEKTIAPDFPAPLLSSSSLARIFHDRLGRCPRITTYQAWSAYARALTERQARVLRHLELDCRRNHQDFTQNASETLAPLTPPEQEAFKTFSYNYLRHTRALCLADATLPTITVGTVAEFMVVLQSVVTTSSSEDPRVKIVPLIPGGPSD